MDGVADTDDDTTPNRPDERFTLASERTFLAWIRTALGLLAGGIALLHVVPDFSTGWVRTTIALVLIVLAIAAPIAGLRRWLQVKEALESGAAMPPEHDLWVFAIAISAIGVVAAIATIVSAA
ncbi:YidH family protein [Rhodococcus gannanensis]|uniref:YidH family protein n=1 Tax=Rhodococcus gannanensis TaxID=1960308 RepID=A0ABW4PDT0_9NOCA